MLYRHRLSKHQEGPLWTKSFSNLRYMCERCKRTKLIARVLTLSAQWYLTTASAYTVSCLFVKLSIGLGFLRILKFRHIDPRWERLACYAVIFVSCAVNLQLFFAVIFECVPEGYMPQDAAYALALRICPLANKHVLISTYVQSIVSVIVDFILVLLPIPSIMKTIMDRKTRTSIIGILLLGVV
jgi:hypothetical protein